MSSAATKSRSFRSSGTSTSWSPSRSVARWAHAFFLPNWFVRRRGLAMGVAFSGVGAGSIILLPGLQAIIGRDGWRAACWATGVLVLALLAPLNLLLKRRPQELGLEPDGDRYAGRAVASSPTTNVVDPAWVAVDWTLGRALHTARFWWIAVGYAAGMFAWYAVQVHQTKYLVEIGFSPTDAAWALGFVSLTAVPGQIGLGHLSDRVGREWVWTVGSANFAVCYLAHSSWPTRQRRRSSTSWSSRRACWGTA